MRIMPTLRPTRPRLIIFSIPACDWAGLTLSTRREIIWRIHTEAGNYSPAVMTSQNEIEGKRPAHCNITLFFVSNHKGLGRGGAGGGRARGPAGRAAAARRGAY